MLSNAQTGSNISNRTAAMTDWLGDGRSAKIKIGHSLTTTNERSLSAHEHLFMANDSQTHIYQVLDGVVGIYKMLADGRRQIVTFCYPGDLIGVENSGTWRHHGEALCDTRIRCISLSTIDALVKSEPAFGQALVQSLATELAETRDQLLSLGRKSALEKVATFLLRISRRNQRENRDETRLFLPMTRAEIADYLGLTIETVSRNITRLKTSGLIRLESKNKVQILDIDQLEDLAEGDFDRALTNHH